METIQDLCRTRLLDRKWLIAPSLKTGTSWLEHVVRQGVSCVNTVPVTVRRLALEFAGGQLAEQGRTVLNSSMAALVVQSAWESLPPDGYFRRLNPTYGLYKAIAQAIEDLRFQELSVSDLKSLSGFEASVQKASDLAILLANWDAYLDQHKLADQAMVLQMATAFVESGNVPASEILLVPAEAEFCGLELRFLKSIAKEQLVRIESPLEFVADDDGEGPDLSFFRSIGEANEVREVLRRCCEESVPLDSIEILHTDAQTYVSLVHEIASLVDHQAGRLPVTFADGLPILTARPIRALRAFLRWAEADFPQQLIVEIFNEGMLESGDLSGPALARILRPLGIKAGGQNYVPRLQKQLDAASVSVQRLSATQDDETQAALTRLQRKIAGLKFLIKTIGELVNLAKVLRSAKSVEALDAAETILLRYVRKANEFDSLAAKSVLQEIVEQKIWIDVLRVELRVTDWLESVIHETSVNESGPKPGCIHLASLATGGQSGRPVTFVIGMDDRRFPGALLQDPILLDGERQSLSPDFSTSSGNLLRKIQGIQQTISRISGALSVSWSCMSISDGSEMFPASLAHKLGQMVYDGESNWNSDCLNEMAGNPVSFAARTNDCAFSDSDLMIGRLARAPDKILGQVKETFPHLVSGGRAFRERHLRFGEFSGRVSATADRSDPFAANGPVYSASALETMGRCGLAFFFSRRLKIYPLDEVDDNLDRWLDAAQFGSLLHELFRRFMASLPLGERPVFDHHWELLRSQLKAIIESYRAEIPPPNESALRKDLTQLIRVARTFLREEERHCATGGIQPLYFEASLGMQKADAEFHTDLDSPEPVPVQLGRDRTIRAKGQIDRVDRRADRMYSVTDYKTGSAFGYSQEKLFGGGRKVQNILYLKMVQTVLRQKLDEEDASVARFEYFFPGTKANGLRLSWSALDLEPGVHVLDTLCSLDAAGLYLPTSDSKDCTFCDYRGVCGNYRRVTKVANDWLYREPEFSGLKDVRHG